MSSLPNLPEELEDENRPSRYVVGIDLGTTNCALAFVDTEQADHVIQTFSIPQLVAAGEVEPRPGLPSFLYLPAAQEFSATQLQLPWKSAAQDSVVGTFARDHGSQVAGRMVASAKSWLCHPGVDRTAKLLPWHGASDVRPLSPVEASAAYLKHLRQAWDHAHPRYPLAEQDVVLTLPASFDEIARELTVEAARQAGLRRVVLIEEPQAAFYAWIDRHRDDWAQRVQPGQLILICDVGGGTTDFTLIHARPDTADPQRVIFHRIAVGEHLILGGDNLDLALAQHLEARLGSEPLGPRAWDVLLKQCRRVKEQLLGADERDTVTINLPGAGSKLIGGGRQVQAQRSDVEPLLLDGFFPQVAIDVALQTQSSGFQEFGLPFAPDPRVTAYLGQFLRQAAQGQTAITPDAATSSLRPDWLLFNGGVFASDKIRQRTVNVLREWYGPHDDAWQLGVLDHDRLDLAVAHGAAYYGLVRRGEGVRIQAGLARAYYVGLGTQPPQAICLVPAGTEPGQSIELTDREFELTVATPVEFPIYVSSTRTNDPPGTMVEVDPEQLRALVPIRTVLKTKSQGQQEQLRVHLEARLTEIGTLELGCREQQGERSWRLQFDVRTATQTDVQSHAGEAETRGFLDEATWETCAQVLDRTFLPAGELEPEAVVKELIAVLDSEKEAWEPSLLRRMWQHLMNRHEGRQRSAKHEARWLNLLGFSLRPGYGMALDDWRVSETWKRLQGKLLHGSAACRTESWILWRRVSGGLSPGQQQTLATPLLTQLKQYHRQATTGRGAGATVDFASNEAAEIWRLLGSLERLPLSQKQELGGWLLDLMNKPKLRAGRAGIVWALGRLGTREPIYGLLNHVIPAQQAETWIGRLIQDGTGDRAELLALMQLARRCHDRFRDVSPQTREQVQAYLQQHQAPEHWIGLVAEGGRLDDEEQAQLLGDSLPVGLRLC